MDSLDVKLYKNAFGIYKLNDEDIAELELQKRVSTERYTHVVNNLARAKLLSLTWFRLLRVPYKQILGPAEAKSLPEWTGMCSMSGQPEFIVKELDGKFYNFQGMPNPGFPGS